MRLSIYERVEMSNASGQSSAPPIAFERFALFALSKPSLSVTVEKTPIHPDTARPQSAARPLPEWSQLLPNAASKEPRLPTHAVTLTTNYMKAIASACFIYRASGPNTIPLVWISTLKALNHLIARERRRAIFPLRRALVHTNTRKVRWASHLKVRVIGG